MDAEYLKNTVGSALAKGLAAVTNARPADPVEFLGMWLLKYVENQGVEVQLKQQAVQLEVERKQYEESLEWERLRIEQEEKQRAEEALAQEQQRQEAQLQQVEEFESSVSEQQSAFLSRLAEEHSSYIMEPLLKLKERLRFISDRLQQVNKAQFLQLFKRPQSSSTASHSAPSTPVSYVISVCHAVVGILDYPITPSTPWPEVQKLLRKPELLSILKVYNPLALQKVRKFAVVTNILKDVSTEDVQKYSFILYLLLEWVRTCLQMRKTALHIRSERLKIPVIHEDNDDVDAIDEHEEDDLEDDLADLAEQADEVDGEADGNDDADGDDAEGDGDDDGGDGDGDEEGGESQDNA